MCGLTRFERGRRSKCHGLSLLGSSLTICCPTDDEFVFLVKKVAGGVSFSPARSLVNFGNGIPN